MNPGLDRLSEEDRRWLIASCAESNVPLIVTDPVALDRAAELLRAPRTEEAK